MNFADTAESVGIKNQARIILIFYQRESAVLLFSLVNLENNLFLGHPLLSLLLRTTFPCESSTMSLENSISNNNEQKIHPNPIDNYITCLELTAKISLTTTPSNPLWPVIESLICTVKALNTQLISYSAQLTKFQQCDTTLILPPLILRRLYPQTKLSPGDLLL